MELAIEFEFFKAHQEALYQKYPNRFLVIIGQEVKADYLTRAEAYDDAKPDDFAKEGE